MSSSINDKNLAEEYSCRLKEKYLELGRRLFLVDYSKSSAAKSLCALLEGEEIDSFLMIVEDRGVAEAFKKILSSILGEIHVIDSENAINEALKGSARDADSLDNFAKTFKKNYKNLIVTRTSKSGLVFNRVIAEDTTRNGAFSGEKIGAYRFSDMLGESAYAFVCVDDIFRQITLEEPEKGKTFTPGAYEEFDFLGETYYVDAAHSIKKLEAITSRSKGCVIISDIVADKDAIELYVAINLLTTNFSHYDTKDKIKPVCSSFYSGGEDGYAGACDVIYDAMTNGRSEDSIISICLQRTKGSKQRIPGDLNSMEEYLAKKMEYMSYEEVFLGVMSSQMKNRFKSGIPSIDAVIENISENYEDMASCFIDMFFANSMKGELESLLSTPHIFEMSAEELRGVYSVFNKYGAYHYLDIDNSRTKIMRFKRDDSGFEYFARRYSKNDVEDSLCYSVLGDMSDDVYKAVQIKRLADGKEADLGFAAPAIIVVNGRFESAFSKVKKALTDFEVEKELDKLTDEGVNKKTAVMVDFDTFRESAHDINAGSVVFFDINPEFVDMKLMLAKAQKLCLGNVFVFATYGDLSGAVVDNWQSEMEQEDKVLPFASGEETLKFGIRHTYSEIVEKINTVYTVLSETVTYSRSNKIKEVSAEINSLISELGKTATFTPELMEFDIEHAARLGKYYTEVFRNTSSVGSDGDSVFAFAKDYDPKGKCGLGEASEAQKCIFFNVCAKMLRRDCDVNCNDCRDCADYKKFLKNDFSVLEDSIARYIQLSKQYITKLSDLKYEIKSDDIIFTQYDDDSKELSVDDISAHEFVLKAAIDNLKLQKADKEFTFHSDYKDVLGIREAVYQLYRKVLRKYFKSVMLIFAESTDMAKKKLIRFRDAVAVSNES